MPFIVLTGASSSGKTAIGEPGTYLWSDQPESYPYFEFLKQQHRVQPSVVWESLFQNRPSPLEGAFFKESWLKTYDRPPPRDQMQVYMAADFAVTAKATADFSVVLVLGLDPAGEIYLLDMFRAQCDAATSILVLAQENFQPQNCDLPSNQHRKP